MVPSPSEDRLRQLLASEARLVTVYGLGGVGTSSLVALALGSTRVTRIDVGSATPRAVRARLAEAPAEATIWLDQVHAPRGLGALVERCAARVILAARRPLGATDEHRVPVPLLVDAAARALVWAALARAGAADPGSDELDRLAALVDGWPLAARAVAPWARVLGVSGVVHRGLFELEGDDARACERVLAQAWRGLPARARALLASLGQSAQGLALGWLDRHDDDALATLVEAGLVVSRDGGVRVPAPVRAFVARHAAARQLAAARRAHGERTLLRAEQARASHRRDPLAAVAELGLVEPDLRALAEGPSARTAVRATLALEPLFLGRLRREHALDLLARATDRARTLDDDALLADVTLVRVRALVMRGEHESAERLLRDTRVLERAPLDRAYRALYLGHIAAWRGETETARLQLDEAEAIAEHAEGTQAEDLREDLLIQRMFLSHVRADLDAVERLARVASERARSRPSPRLGAIARRFVAESALRRGRAPEAARLFEQSRDELASFGDHAAAIGTATRLVEALRTAGETARADAEAAAGRAAAARAGESTLELLGLAEGGITSWARVADLAWRVQIPIVREQAERWLAAHAPEVPPSTLRLDPEARTAELDGQVLALGRRATPWRVLEALVRAHASASAVSVSDLFRAAWPGERADAASQKKRVQTALWTLRKLGLDAVLRTVPEGYAIAPDVRVGTRAAPATSATPR